MVKNHRELSDDVYDIISRYCSVQRGIVADRIYKDPTVALLSAVERLVDSYLYDSLVERLESCDETRYAKIIDYLVESHERACFAFEGVHGQ